MKRAYLMYKEESNGEADAAVKRWLGRYAPGTPSYFHSLAADVCDGLSWGWDRRLEGGRWLLGLNGPPASCDPGELVGPAWERWDKHKETGIAVRSLLLLKEGEVDKQNCCKAVRDDLRQSLSLDQRR
jgi:hypothetical protein